MLNSHIASHLHILCFGYMKFHCIHVLILSVIDKPTASNDESHIETVDYAAAGKSQCKQ